MYGTSESSGVKPEEYHPSLVITSSYWKEVVVGGKTKEEILVWANKESITLEQLGNAEWLSSGSSKPTSEGGVNKSYAGLYSAIAADHRFQSESMADWNKFREFLGLNLRTKADFKPIVTSWKTKEDAISWAQQKGITLEQLGNSRWLTTSAATPKSEGGIGKRLIGLYNAIVSDSRFQNESKKDWNKFREFLGLKARARVNIKVDYKPIVASWNTKNDAILWAKNEGISLEKLGNSGWLNVGSAKPNSDGGIGKSLGGLYYAIKSDSRFRNESETDWNIFREFLGLEVKLLVDYKTIVAAWKTREHALLLAKNEGITLEQLSCSKWLQQTAARPNEDGGMNKPLGGLYTAIVADPRFQSESRADWNKFRVFLGLEASVDFKSLVASWKSKDEAIIWAKDEGITLTQLGNSNWLVRISAKSSADGGIGRSLKGLYNEITDDLRFQTESKADFSKFKLFLELAVVKDDYEAIVFAWKSPHDAEGWAKDNGISKEQLIDRYWLLTVAKNPVDEGGIGRSLATFYRALIERFGAFKEYTDWITPSNTASQLELIRQLFSGTEGNTLGDLAEEQGEIALAEYLAVVHQDKFKNYDPELIENLRKYLGEIEAKKSSKSGEEPQLPDGIFIIDKLSNLRQAIFNNYRDKYQPFFSEGIDKVIEVLEEKKNRQESAAGRRFIQSVQDYFLDVEFLEHPERLKDSLTSDRAFPAPHQKMAIYQLAKERAVLLADEMGGGKTGSAIGSFESLRDKGLAKKALIICPSKVLPVWKAALSNGEVGYFKKGQEPKVTIIEKDNKDWGAAAEAEYVVISLEMTRGKTDKISNEQHLKELAFDMLIFDEAHNAKNVTGSDTARIFSISQSKTIINGHLMLLSGTPVPNTIVDLAAQLRLLYANREEVSGVNIEDIREVSKHILKSPPLLVRNLLIRRMMRRKTEDCLPVGCDYERQVFPISFNPLQQALYNSTVENPFFTATEKIGRLRRDCLEAKYDHIKSAVERVLNDSKYTAAHRPPKMVIAESAYAKGFTRDREDNRQKEGLGKETYIASRLANEYGDTLEIFILDGKSSQRREQILLDFAECKTPAALITLVSVSGEGLNITCAADGILVSPTYTVAAEEQFIRRMLRSGQKLSVRLQILSFSETIEEGILGYCKRKHRLVSGLVDGRPLYEREKAFLKEDNQKAKKSKPLQYEAKTPRQQALDILRRLKGMGKEAIKEYLYADDGKYAKDFARGYIADEETSYSGNTARLVTAVINSLPHLSATRKVADIACGCRTLERMYEKDSSVNVSSVDINEPALIAGGELLDIPKDIIPAEVGTMDELPFTDASMDTAVISLALDMTQHSHNEKRGASRFERIKTLQELNRVLKIGGNAVLTLQVSLFSNQGQFDCFVGAVEDNFGFELVGQMSGLATAFNKEKGEKYESWIVVLKKVAEAPELDLKQIKLFRALQFPRVTIKNQETNGKSKEIAEHKSGAFQDNFSIGAKRAVKYQSTTMPQLELEAARLSNEFKQKKLSERVAQLLKDYGSIKDIPDELLLSITPEAVSISTQKERDEYYRILLDRYVTVDRIPVEKITSQNSFILIEGDCKKRGKYLALAKLNPKTKKFGGCKTKYYYDD